jgi:hypothetical protein
MELKIFSSIGYGFCPPTAVSMTEEDEAELVYRYVPPQLVDTSERRIIGGFNAAAAEGATDEEEADRVLLDSIESAEDFSEAGRQLFERMPIYAILRIRAEMSEWEAHWDGVPAVTLRAEQHEPLLEEALKLPPQQLWAQKHLSTVTRYLYGAGDPNAAAMPMAPGLGEDSEHSEDLPRVAVEEKVEYPWGLWKVILMPIDEETRQSLEQWSKEGEQFKIVPGTLGVLRNDEFTYSPLEFIRWEIPATLVPNIVRWAEREDILYKEPWAPLGVMPYYDWQSPIASIPMEGEALAGMAAAYVIPKALDEMQAEFREWMEAELRRQSKENF